MAPFVAKPHEAYDINRNTCIVFLVYLFPYLLELTLINPSYRVLQYNAASH